MWNYEENINFNELYNDEDKFIEDDESADSEIEALMYSRIHYQQVDGEELRPTTNITRQGLGNDQIETEKDIYQPKIEQTEIASSSKDTKLIINSPHVASNRKRSSQRLASKTNETVTYTNNRLTQFVSVSEDKQADTKIQEKTLFVDLVSSTNSDSDVKVLEEVKRTDNKYKKSSKKIEKLLLMTSDSEDDDDIQVILPSDININVQPKEEVRVNSQKISVHSNNFHDNGPQPKKRKSRDNTQDKSWEEKMRKFYDSETEESDEEETINCAGNWNISVEDRYNFKSGLRRYYASNSRERRQKCGNCQQWGHHMRSCPDPKRVRHCHLCGERYHQAGRCLYAVCSRCSSVGHDERRCTVTSTESHKRCKRCHVRGHVHASCPDLWRRYYLTTTEGPIVKGSGKTNPRVFCYNCGKPGHWGHKCPFPLMNRRLKPAYPFIIDYEDTPVAYKTNGKDKMVEVSNRNWKATIDHFKNRKSKNRQSRDDKTIEKRECDRNESTSKQNAESRSKQNAESRSKQNAESRSKQNAESRSKQNAESRSKQNAETRKFAEVSAASSSFLASTFKKFKSKEKPRKTVVYSSSSKKSDDAFEYPKKTQNGKI